MLVGGAGVLPGGEDVVVGAAVVARGMRVCVSISLNASDGAIRAMHPLPRGGLLRACAVGQVPDVDDTQHHGIMQTWLGETLQPLQELGESIVIGKLQSRRLVDAHQDKPRRVVKEGCSREVCHIHGLHAQRALTHVMYTTQYYLVVIPIDMVSIPRIRDEASAIT